MQLNKNYPLRAIRKFEEQPTAKIVKLNLKKEHGLRFSSGLKYFYREITLMQPLRG